MELARTFFITTVTAQRRPIFRCDRTARLLVDVLSHYRSQRKFRLHDFVIMPDHLHAILTPAPEISLERAVQFIKGGFSFRLKSRLPVWQESFTNHRIRDDNDLSRYSEYIRLNPIRAAVVKMQAVYPWSSAAGLLELDPVPQGLKPEWLPSLTRP